MLYCPFRTCRLCSDPVNIMAPYSHFGALFRSVAYNLFRSTATGAHNPQPGRRRRDLTPQDQPHNPQHRGKHRLASTAQQPIPHQSRCAHRSGIHPIGGPHIRRHRSRGRVGGYQQHHRATVVHPAGAGGRCRQGQRAPAGGRERGKPVNVLSWVRTPARATATPPWAAATTRPRTSIMRTRRSWRRSPPTAPTSIGFDPPRFHGRRPQLLHGQRHHPRAVLRAVQLDLRQRLLLWGRPGVRGRLHGERGERADRPGHPGGRGGGLPGPEQHDRRAGRRGHLYPVRHPGHLYRSGPEAGLAASRRHPGHAVRPHAPRHRHGWLGRHANNTTAIPHQGAAQRGAQQEPVHQQPAALPAGPRRAGIAQHQRRPGGRRHPWPDWP